MKWDDRLAKLSGEEGMVVQQDKETVQSAPCDRAKDCTFDAWTEIEVRQAIALTTTDGMQSDKQLETFAASLCTSKHRNT